MNKTRVLVVTAAFLALMASLASITPLHAQTPDFNVAAAPYQICVSPGESASYLVTVSSTGGFQGNVELSDSIDPNATNGPTLSPIPSSVSLTSGQNVTFTLTASTVQATPEQSYTITIIGWTNVSVQSATVYWYPTLSLLQLLSVQARERQHYSTIDEPESDDSKANLELFLSFFSTRQAFTSPGKNP